MSSLRTEVLRTMGKWGTSRSIVGVLALGVLMLVASSAPGDVHTSGSLRPAGPTFGGPQSAVSPVGGPADALHAVTAPGRFAPAAPTPEGDLAVREQAVQAAMNAAGDLYEADSAAVQQAAAAYTQATVEVLDQFGCASEIMDDQNAAFADFIAAQATAEDALIQSNATANAASDARKVALDALAQAQAARTTAQQAENAVNELIKQQKAALATAMRNKAAALASYSQLKMENHKIEAQLAVLAATDRTNSTAGTGSLSAVPTTISDYDMMPIHGVMSSPFGMRFDPIYKRWQLHAGVDIAAPTGTPIRAARAGTVIRAGWDGGNGNYTCVDTGLYRGAGTYHDKDVVNCYAHQSKILVHVGQQVGLGQVIGKVGMTGAATGPHLHFEVRVDGTPVQPLNWLPACFC